MIYLMTDHTHSNVVMLKSKGTSHLHDVSFCVVVVFGIIGQLTTHLPRLKILVLRQRHV